MNINSLTIKAQEALQQAFALAQRGGQQALDPLHILSTLIAEDSCEKYCSPVAPDTCGNAATAR